MPFVGGSFKSMEYLIAVDLEGIHGVVGEPNVGLLRTVADYQKAVEGAVVEINTVVSALFDSGATKVVVWDNHAGGGNIDFSKVDPRAEQYIPDNTLPRMSFCANYHFAGIIFLGYHAKEGTLGGILAHTYSSVNNQYLKLNGKQLGELDFDSCIAGEWGIPVLFVASDDKAVAQMKERNPDTVTVITKYGKGRNEAELRTRGEVVKDIYEGVKLAVSKDIQPVKFTFPCVFEARYTRMEFAAWIFETHQGKLADLRYGEDAHVLQATFRNIDDLRLFF